MKLILARHGNTFSPQDKVTWVGCNSDLPLVEKGISQAERLATVLNGVRLSAIYCAPLLRTKHFAEIVAAQSNMSSVIEDFRLIELDYGQWDGLTDAEIVARFGEQSLKGWLDSSIWPSQSGWKSNEKTVSGEISEFVSELVTTYPDDANVLVVSSNGRLRYFLNLIAGEFEKRIAEHTFKVGTGQVCLLVAQPNDVQLALWNEQPESLTRFLVGVA